MDIVDMLDRAFRHTHTVIAGVRPDQLGNDTPCEGWTVRELLDHTIGVVAGLGAAASGLAPAGSFELSSDPAGQFEQAAAATLAAWRTPGVLDKVIDGGAGPMPGRVLAGINLLDTATHSWDIATATGQVAALPTDLALATLEVSRQTIAPEIRPGRFDVEVPVADDADATSRLVGFLGRTP